jgi:hypothetical protein
MSALRAGRQRLASADQERGHGRRAARVVRRIRGTLVLLAASLAVFAA